MNRLRELQRAEKLTQQELADYFGVSEAYLLGYNNVKNETNIKAAVLDEALEKLRAINNMLSVESDEAPNMWTAGFLTAIAAIENFKKEIELEGEQ